MRSLLFTAIAIIFLFTLNSCTTKKSIGELLAEKGSIEAESGWFCIGKNEAGINFYVDSASRKKLPDNRYRAWIKIVVTDPSDERNYSMAFEEFDCTNKRRKVLQETVFGKDGSSKSFPEGNWEDIAPDSAGEGIYNAVCGKEMKKCGTEKKKKEQSKGIEETK